MKILLINPISNLAKDSRRYRRFISSLPPSGLAYIGSVLEKNGFEVIIEDQFANKISNKMILKKIRNEAPQVIGFSCLTPVISNVIELVSEIRSFNADIKIVLGNIHPTLFSDQLLKQKLADIIVRGEGEYTMLELALALKHKEKLNNIKGLSFLENGNVCHNSEREPIDDLDTLPYPAWNLLDLKYYKNFPIIALYNKPILPIQASRGCSYHCLFCSQDKIYKKSRYRRIESVIDEIEYLSKKFDIKYFGFNDAYFPFSIEHGLKFCQEFRRRGLHKKINWITETRVDKVNLDLLKEMKASGLQLILYGFEVGNQSILDSTGKMTTLEQARKAMINTRKSGIRTTGLFMLGLPGETKDTCEQTIRFAKELNPDIAKFNIAVPFPGSRFFESFKDKCSILETDKFTSWYDFSSYSDDIIYVPESINNKILVNLQRKAMFQFYARPQQIIKHLYKGTFSFADMCYGVYVLISNFLKTLF